MLLFIYSTALINKFKANDTVESYKVALLGAPGVGKTTISVQFSTSDYICVYDTSIGEWFPLYCRCYRVYENINHSAISCRDGITFYRFYFPREYYSQEHWYVTYVFKVRKPHSVRNRVVKNGFFSRFLLNMLKNYPAIAIGYSCTTAQTVIKNWTNVLFHILLYQ